MERERERYPEAWIGKRVSMTGPPHRRGVLRDVNEYGIAYETLTQKQLVFVPWARVEGLRLSATQPTES